jgi:uncharacterized protein YigE (DUF2233 family)
MPKYCFVYILVLITYLPIKTEAQNVQWKELAKGFFTTEIALPEKSSHGDSKVTVVKIDTKIYNFHLTCATEQADGEKKTAEEWAKEKSFLLVVNAGMFDGQNEKGEEDAKTNRGLMINYKHKNNGKLNSGKTQKAVLAFNPKNANVPVVKIIDLLHEDWNYWKNQYNSYSQGLHLIDIQQKNCRSKDAKKWSMIIVAVDKSGNLLFIFTRSPYTMYNHINNLLKLPLNINNAMYLEGGPETSLYVSVNGTVIQKIGSYETGFNENDNNNRFWNLPNIIGVTRKEE